MSEIVEGGYCHFGLLPAFTGENDEPLCGSGVVKQYLTAAIGQGNHQCSPTINTDKVICSPYRSSLHNFKKMKVALRYLVIFGKYDELLATVDERLFY